MATTTDDFFDPFAEHTVREPMTGAGVTVVVLFQGDADPDRARAVGESVESLLTEVKRPVTTELAPVLPDGRGAAVSRALADASHPLVLFTDATEPWTSAHLDPLLDAIDQCDHVVGRRDIGLLGSLGRWLGSLPWRGVFAVPLQDVHSPCRLHRTEKLAAIPLQSRGSFLDVEIPAKATYLGQLLNEVDVPPLASAGPKSARGDLSTVFNHPEFHFTSAPSEDPEGEGEGPDRPEGEDAERGGDLDEGRPVEDHGAERVEELGER